MLRPLGTLQGSGLPSLEFLAPSRDRGTLQWVIGTLQATEVLKELIGLGETMSGKLLIFDAMNMQFRKIRYKRRLDCLLCGDAPSIKDII